MIGTHLVTEDETYSDTVKNVYVCGEYVFALACAIQDPMRITLKPPQIRV